MILGELNWKKVLGILLQLIEVYECQQAVILP